MNIVVVSLVGREDCVILHMTREIKVKLTSVEKEILASVWCTLKTQSGHLEGAVLSLEEGDRFIIRVSCRA